MAEFLILKREGDDWRPTSIVQPDPDAEFDHGACAAVAEIAVRAGAGGLVALDLYTEFVRPGWSPFPTPGVEERTAGVDGSAA